MCECGVKSNYGLVPSELGRTIEVARARNEEKKLDEHRPRAGRTVQSPIVLFDEGDEDEDDTARLS